LEIARLWHFGSLPWSRDNREIGGTSPRESLMSIRLYPGSNQ
jgi:hypothetical protein